MNSIGQDFNRKSSNPRLFQACQLSGSPPNETSESVTKNVVMLIYLEAIWLDAILEATEKIARFRSSVGILQGKVSVLVKASSD